MDRQQTQEWIEQMYSRGYRPHWRWFNDPQLFQDVTELVSVALGCAAFAGACWLVAKWVLVG